MKKHPYYLAILCLVLNACGPVYVVHQDPAPPASTPAPDQPEEVSYQAFYDQLSPYGQWIDDPDYGYVWQPDAGPDFKPYATNGNWVYTDDGWAWNSGYPWGWATFHYGRWFFEDDYGWMWAPGNEWAPAWVSWRSGDDYYGWAPLGPDIGFAAADGYNPPPQYWSFVPHRYITSPQINNYYVREVNNTSVINTTTIVVARRSNYGGGPDAGEVGRFTGAPVRSVRMTLYRPRVTPPANNPRPGNGGRPAIAPARFQPLSKARRIDHPATTAPLPPGTSPRPASSPASPANPPIRSGNPNDPRPGNPPVPPTNTRPGSFPASSPGNPAATHPPATHPPATYPPTAPAGQPHLLPATNQPLNRPVTLPSARPPGQTGQPAPRPPFNPPARPPVNPPDRAGATVHPPNTAPVGGLPPPGPAPVKVLPPPNPKPQDPQKQ